MRIARISLLFVVAISHVASGCGSRPTPRADDTCVVLSVGEAKGLAHLGALDALKAHGLSPRRVFGNSMGSLVGSLYATAPNADLRTRYRELMAAYAQRTKQDARQRAGAGALLGLGLVIVSGGTLGWGTVAGSAVAGGVTTSKLDDRRFAAVLDSMYGHAAIENLPVRFGTSYQHRNDRGLNLDVALTGNVAEAVSRSVANPFIFEDVEVKTATYLDPGADRSAAIPIDEACRAFPGSLILALNVTGGPVKIDRQTACEVIQIDVPVGKVEPSAMIGDGPEFDRAYRAGFDAVERARLF